MLDTAAIATALTGLVGWHPDPAGKVTLPPELLESTSGLYMQDASELLTLDVLQNLVPRGEALPAWLLRLQTDALKRFVPALAAAQSLNGQVLLAETSLTNGPGNRANIVNKLSRFVGLQLKVVKKLGVSYSLPAISLQLDGALVVPLTLYLYADTQPEPLATIEIPVGNKPNFPLVVPLSGADAVALPSGTRLFLGYYEDDLPLGVHAIQREFTGLGCGCTGDTQPTWSKHVHARAIAVPAAQLDPNRELFDTDFVVEDSQNFGLNLFFFGYCNVATALSSDDNLSRLAPLAQQALAVRLYEAIVSSPNITQLTGRPDVQVDARYALFVTQAKLYGGRVPDTQEVYPSALNKLVLDLSGLDAACGPASTSLLSMGGLTR